MRLPSIASYTHRSGTTPSASQTSGQSRATSLTDQSDQGRTSLVATLNLGAAPPPSFSEDTSRPPSYGTSTGISQSPTQTSNIRRWVFAPRRQTLGELGLIEFGRQVGVWLTQKLNASSRGQDTWEMAQLLEWTVETASIACQTGTLRWEMLLALAICKARPRPNRAGDL